jgi:hypothetical protein
MAPTCKASQEMQRILASDIDNRERRQLREKRETRLQGHADSRSDMPGEEDRTGDKVGLLSMTGGSNNEIEDTQLVAGSMSSSAHIVRRDAKERQRKRKARTCCRKLLGWLLCDKNTVRGACRILVRAWWRL